MCEGAAPDILHVLATRTKIADDVVTEAGPHPGRHARGITADVDDRPATEEFVDTCTEASDKVLHLGLRNLPGGVAIGTDDRFA